VEAELDDGGDQGTRGTVNEVDTNHRVTARGLSHARSHVLGDDRAEQ
jgi:hypothetical protein